MAEVVKPVVVEVVKPVMVSMAVNTDLVEGSSFPFLLDFVSDHFRRKQSSKSRSRTPSWSPRAPALLLLKLKVRISLISHIIILTVLS